VKIILSILILLSIVSLVTTMHQISYAEGSHPFSQKWGLSGSDPGEFMYPESLAVDDQGFIYVTDLGNTRIQKFDSAGEIVGVWGQNGIGPGEFSVPTGIATFEDFVFVVDNTQDNIQKFDSDGNFTLRWGDTGKGPGEFIKTYAIDINSSVFSSMVSFTKVSVLSIFGVMNF